MIAALGWSGIGIVTREYYVRNSREFIDYVMAGPSALGAKPGPLLAMEAKALQSDLTEKNAAQLIQYCSVEGIEWAVLTNGRELQFFNTFLKPDLSAKRILRLDLLAFNDDDEFGILFEQLWQLSRESMTTERSRAWLNQLRLDQAVRKIMLNPGSSTIRQLRKVLADTEVKASPQELVQWFRTHLSSPITRVGPSTVAG
ncbi:MAG TPA: type I restriction enzyme HsdR N-terminal domain-containing protein, partial [Nitrolancea sp.]|nr:type I restriction enzyme HsdR N-terminal domain-containing protein [Nitrolancea sp.]